MEDFKSILTSKTFWGVAVSVIGKVLALSVGVVIDGETEAKLVELAMLGVSFIGDAGAIYGRIKATKLITK